MIFTTDRMKDVARLVHRVRVQIDPAFRGELVRLFENPKARMAYFSKNGLLMDELTEAIWDAGLTFERPTIIETLELLKTLFTPGTLRAKISKAEVKGELAEVYAGLETELDKRRRDRRRTFRCSCFGSPAVRFDRDELPSAMARAICDECGAPWTLQTIKLDLSNRTVPISADEVYQ